MYLYGEAARTASRQSLPAIRAGEYEALPEKVRCPLPVGSLGADPAGWALLRLPSPTGLPTAQAG